ncbi:twin-arginine translocase subunit TatC, partial [Gilvimarinus sp. 1_MG-2023]
MSQDQEQPLIAHLVELRNRLLKSVLVVLALFLGMFYFANDLYLILVQPLSVLLPETQGQMIAIG